MLYVNGLFDENKLNEYIANLKETSPVGYESWINYEKQVANNALQQNYFNLVKAGLTGTLAEGELEHKLQGNKVDIKFVQVCTLYSFRRKNYEKFHNNH